MRLIVDGPLGTLTYSLERHIVLDDIKEVFRWAKGLSRRDAEYIYCQSKLINKRHLDAAKALREDPSITIRRADKADLYVLLPSSEYLEKIDSILKDESKFLEISRNPTEEIKRRANKIIEKVNAKAGGLKLPKLVGDFGLGYCYGNVKIHKNNNPLRPIISQIPTPTYQIAKKLNEWLTPFVPKDYTLSSAADFLHLLHNSNADGVIASLDVESLFTNIDVDRTINFIIDEIYPAEGSPKLDIPETALRTLLEMYVAKLLRKVNTETDCESQQEGPKQGLEIDPKVESIHQHKEM
ncbi:uncharacterized protein LOC143018738 [Oratosquilla oratoria]|uniref:uncharacterized protein LOC143018738 n=1 Tax=Oratosquilla oratoria TaxID=337810 RepID=UPI003F75F525